MTKTEQKTDDMSVREEIQSITIVLLCGFYLLGLHCIIDYFSQDYLHPLGSGSYFEDSL